MMGYTLSGPVVWPYLPEWSNPVNETLAFLTDVMQAASGPQQARGLRDAPRRGFAFQSLVNRDDRRIADAVRFDIGIKPFQLPIYPDVQLLAAPLAAGATAVPCRTAGFDFVAGGRALLWSSTTAWDVVTIDSIAADSLALSVESTSAWPVGTRLYPLRRARVLDAPKASARNDETETVDIQCQIDEPCDWPAAFPTATLYRGQPVLEWRNEESEDPTTQYTRLSGAVDFDVGPAYYYDLPHQPLRAQSQRFQLYQRADHSAFRSLAYALNGRAAQCWVPSWMTDVCLAQPLASNATQLQVPWMGYTDFGYQQQGRRDVAIELFDGRVFYRRITGSADAGDHEVLQLDSALGVAVDPSKVRQIGWLTLCASASDTFQIEHDTDADGIAVAKVDWQQVPANV